MVDQRLVSFIRKALKKGVSLKDIKSQLKARGWSDKDVNDAVEFAIPSQTPIPKEKTGQKIGKKHFKYFIAGGIILILILSFFFIKSMFIRIGGVEFVPATEKEESGESFQEAVKEEASYVLEILEIINPETLFEQYQEGRSYKMIDSRVIRFYKDKIVWSNMNFNTFHLFIALYDLSTGKGTLISNVSQMSAEEGAEIYEDKVVWADCDYSNKPLICSIFIYDLATGKKTQIKTDKSYKHSLHMHKNKIIWDGQDIEGGILVYDLSTGQETKVLESETGITPLDIFEDKVVYKKAVYKEYAHAQLLDESGIYVYDSSTDKKTKIADKSQIRGTYYADIYEDKVFWSNRNSVQTWIYDLTTNHETLISDSLHDVEKYRKRGSPYFHEGKIVMIKIDESDKIRIYNPLTEEETLITSPIPLPNKGISIYDDKVIWKDYTNCSSKTNSNVECIYVATIIEE